jgi:uncharacterized protein YcfL
MNLPARPGAVLALLLLAACGGPEERPFNEQFNSTFLGLENRAVAIEAEASNSVSAQEAELDREARELANSIAPETDQTVQENVQNGAE